MLKLWRLLLWLAALLLAAAPPAAIFALVEQHAGMFRLALIIAVIFAIVLGLPLYGWASRRGSPVPSWIAALCGFAVGATPIAIMSMAVVGGNASSGGVPTIVNGVRTARGWLEAAEVICGFGLLGVVGGLVFWLAAPDAFWRRTDGASPRPRPFADLAIVAGGALVLAGSVLAPEIGKDRSCHNVFRHGGRTSVNSEILAELDVGRADWPATDALLKTFARERNWSYRADLRTDPGFPWFQVSLCTEPGTVIFAEAVPSMNGVMIGVLQPQGGLSWRKPFAVLYQRLTARWPDRVHFKGDGGENIEAPSWLLAPDARSPR